MKPMDKLVVLARGLGTRMQASDGGAALETQQARAADAGMKGMMPVAGGRPFMDYVLHEAAEAGLTKVCLVIAPEHLAVREYYGRLAMRRITVEYAVQERPRGTADAVAAAEAFAGADPFAVINGDNLYPTAAFAALRAAAGPAGAFFRREPLIAGGNIPPERVAKFALVQAGADGRLVKIVEKPGPAELAAAGADACVSMNCWRFGPEIFEAARRIAPSPRGELELTDAVQYAVDTLGVRFEVLRMSAGVLDLSCRGDVAEVGRRLAKVEVQL
ncbi:MAG: sugar phosphate nucleotidyltransferase [Planctomycetota bacterium]|nr:sugar phosphate nucleotidyltransferase [Planctomycetota bacterium]